MILKTYHFWFPIEEKELHWTPRYVAAAWEMLRFVVGASGMIIFAVMDPLLLTNR